MRLNRASGVLSALAVLFLAAFVGCEGEQGPAGPAGTTECFNCHTDDYSMAQFLKPKETQFALSAHALSDTYLRSEDPCSRCHTNEGYQRVVATGEVGEVADPSHIHCWTCHAPHTNMDFSQRKQGVTEYMNGGTYDREESNTCAMCHQTRPPEPLPADGAVVTSSRWGPHHAPQSNILIGVGAYDMPDAAPYQSGYQHGRIEDGCVRCHMAEPAPEAEVGGHTFEVAYDDGDMINSATCLECHSGDFLDDEEAAAFVEASQEAFGIELDGLLRDLMAMGWVDSSGRILAEDGERVSSDNPRTFSSADDMKAIFNYLMLLEDKSMGVHNHRFAEDVLAKTQAYVQSRMEVPLALH